MNDGSIRWRGITTGIGLWILLYLGLSITLFVLFSLTRSSPETGPSLAAIAFTLGLVVVALAFLAVVIDRLLFTRKPTDLLLRQSVWVIVLAVSTVVSTAAILLTVAVTPGNAALFGITIALPTTMALFVAVNFARYRSLEHRP
ncbi:MAG: hypothetical protein ACQET5_01510 [Halobacteriota archaeon]|uniref:hypothetical protein n=1 Tax=Natronomonas sp. TaxID=2184060 RepID=UPI00397560C2